MQYNGLALLLRAFFFVLGVLAVLFIRGVLEGLQ